MSANRTSTRIAAAPTAGSLLRQYEPPSTRYDEMVDDIEVPRPHWRGFLEHLLSLPSETMERRAHLVDSAIQSDGVTYNVYADPKGTSRPWELDLLPLILPSDEWVTIARGVAQRARLLDAVLADLYGPQELLAEGLIPPALVYGQRSFMWPLLGVEPPGKTRLHVYAADVARSPDGKFWILADRTRGPSGAGYALQNRMTLARAFPDALTKIPVEQLGGFFSALQDTLYSTSAARGEQPVAVLLTPGPYNETYFEHSFLARYLGFPLVEGQDLLVRDGRVYLKTLRGLRRVHAILRRLDDDFCDPVELRADSALGIPGLVHAIRAGNVLVANALGSGLLETSAFSGFYPAVSKRLFGEDLELPSIATWWCGEPPALAHVLEHMDELVIKSSYPSMKMEPVFGHTLAAREREDLVRRMRAQPHAYVAQEWIHLSQSPTWQRDTGRLVPRATTLRVFAVKAPSGWVVMPGGLTRVARHETDVVSMQGGGASKDTWALAARPEPRPLLRRPRLGVADVARSVVDIASRVGENLFWMGRYAERCEGYARLLRAALVRVADAAESEAHAVATLASTCAKLEVFPRLSSASDLSAAAARPPDFVAAVLDRNVPGSLASNVLRLVFAANNVRERMSTDNWHVMNRLGERMPPCETAVGAALLWLDEVMMACVSLAGFALDDMTRDESWHFLLVGRRLERLAHLAGVLAHVLAMDHADREAALTWLLETANSIVTFRARYRRSPELLPVLHLVVLDETNPHSIVFQLRDLDTLLRRVVAELGGSAAKAAQGDVLAALTDEITHASLSGFEAEAGDEVDRAAAALAALLARIERAAQALSDDLQRRFFNHAASPVPLGIGER